MNDYVCLQWSFISHFTNLGNKNRSSFHDSIMEEGLKITLALRYVNVDILSQYTKL